MRKLVMLHGFGTDSRIFASISSKLSSKYDITMVDIPGHGQTHEKFTDFKSAANTIINALKNGLDGHFSLLGWSMGGQIAIEIYKQAPQLIESLILMSTTPKFVGSDGFNAGMNKTVFNKFYKGINNDHIKTMDRFYKLMFSENEDSKLYLEHLNKQIPDKTTLISCMEDFMFADERSIIPAIEVPTLIISGELDEIVSTKASIYMNQEIKNSTLKIFKNTGHAPHLTREKEVVNELTEFLK